jgi:hypothetical protein
MTYSTRSHSNWGDLEALGRRHISTLPRYWVTRLYVALSSFASIVVIWNEPEALTHRLISQSGAPGWWLVGLLAVVAVAGIVDVVINDLLPDHYRLECAKRYRHLIYVALSMGLACMCFVFVAGSGGWFRSLVTPFLIDASFALFIAFLDLFQRHRGRS